MIEKQREKEFLFELERLYHNYYLAVGTKCHYHESTDTVIVSPVLVDVTKDSIDETTKEIEMYIDLLK